MLASVLSDLVCERAGAVAEQQPRNYMLAATDRDRYLS